MSILPGDNGSNGRAVPYELTCEVAVVDVVSGCGGGGLELT